MAPKNITELQQIATIIDMKCHIINWKCFPNHQPSVDVGLSDHETLLSTVAHSNLDTLELHRRVKLNFQSL